MTMQLAGIGSRTRLLGWGTGLAALGTAVLLVLPLAHHAYVAAVLPALSWAVLLATALRPDVDVYAL